MRRLASIIFIFLSVFLAGCEKEDVGHLRIDKIYLKDSVKRTLPVASNVHLDSFYFKGTINGRPVNWVVTDYTNPLDIPYRYKNASGTGKLQLDCVHSFCGFIVQNGVIHENTTQGIVKNYIAAGINIATKTGNILEAYNWFLPGNKKFGRARNTLSDPVKNGVYIYYVDENGKEWSTDFGKSQPPGSVFKVISLQDEKRKEVHSLKKWKAQFDCVLYDKLGRMITLQNGEMYVPIFPK